MAGGLRHLLAGGIERWAERQSRPLPADELARPALVFAPHQDDETLGCGGVIALKRQLDADVSVVFLTDGRTSHGRFLEGDVLAARRREEAVAACAELGVAASDVHFLGFPDGELGRHLAAAARAVGECLRAAADRQIFVPYRGDTTPDHVHAREAVLAAVMEAATARPATICEYPVWFWHHWPWAAPELARRAHYPRLLQEGMGAVRRRLRDLVEYVDIGSVQDVKRRALARHLTQTRRPPEHPDWPILADVAGGSWLPLFFSGREHYHRYTVAAEDVIHAG